MPMRFVLVCSLLATMPSCVEDGGDDAAADTSGGSGTEGTAEASADDTDSSADTTEGSPFDEAMIIAQAADYENSLVKINDQPFPSEHGLADMVNVYIDAGAADLYRTLDPEAPVEVALPEGTLVVKEHLDADGAYDGYLMMYRGPDDYAPETGNWFWARIDGGGETRESGASGSVGFCISCHTPAPSLVFGVAADNQL